MIQPFFKPSEIKLSGLFYFLALSFPTNPELPSYTMKLKWLSLLKQRREIGEKQSDTCAILPHNLPSHDSATNLSEISLAQNSEEGETLQPETSSVDLEKSLEKQKKRYCGCFPSRLSCCITICITISVILLFLGRIIKINFFDDLNFF